MLCALVFPSAAVGAPWMEEKGAARPPDGYLSFCRAERGLCAEDRRPGGAPRPLDAAGMAGLRALNSRVNAMISPVVEARDEWRLGVAEGDCEDYALAKRAALLSAGWAPSQALIAIVEDPFGAPHAVLVVRTSQGDFILDNLTDQVLRWDEADLTYLARQSARLPAMWVRL